MPSVLVALALTLGWMPAVPGVNVVTVVKHVPYVESSADPMHRLDIYIPDGKASAPVLFWVHGGGLTGDDRGSNDNAPVGQRFASEGYVSVVPSYRLSPQVTHPAHIEDVAKAFAWTCDNIGKYGGKKEQLFLCGHSAGGHLVSLLATDPQYLKAEKHSPSEVKGVATFSGVYEIVPTVTVLETAFGKDEKVCKLASPLTHCATGKHPPFLIAYADTDFPRLDQTALNMHAALAKAESPVELVKCKDRNHYTIIIQFVKSDDPLNKAFREFVQKNCK